MVNQRTRVAVKREINYSEESCQAVRELKLICEVLRGDICVIRQRPCIKMVMGLIT